MIFEVLGVIIVAIIAVAAFIFVREKYQCDTAVSEAKRAYEKQDWSALRKALSFEVSFSVHSYFMVPSLETFCYLRILLQEHDNNIYESQVACLDYLTCFPSGQRFEEVLRKFETLHAQHRFDLVRFEREDPCSFSRYSKIIKKLISKMS